MPLVCVGSGRRIFRLKEKLTPPFGGVILWGISMKTIDVIKNRILELCAQRNLTINALAELSALPPSSLKNILYGKSQNPKILTIKILCGGLGITLGEFFGTAEFDALEQEIE